MADTAFSFLSLTTHPTEPEDAYHHHDFSDHHRQSTHDCVEWFLYGEDHSLLLARPPTTFLKLTADNDDDSQEEDESQGTFSSITSTHDPCLYSHKYNNDDENLSNRR